MLTPRLKKNIKHGLALILHYSGLGRRVLLARTAGKCLALMYHRVMPPEMLQNSPSNDAIQLSTQIFERQLQFLAGIFNPISVQELAGHLQGERPLAGRRIMITFDDGWKDNHDHAFALLRKQGMPAIIFISTGFIGSPNRFWQERLFSMLAVAPSAKEAARQQLSELLSGHDLAFLAEENAQRRRDMLSALIQRIKTIGYERIEALIANIEAWSRHHGLISGISPYNEKDFLSWDEIFRMHRAGIEFGSHGVDHRILTKEGVDIAYELKQSKKDIETKLGTPALSISYPNGDCNRKILDMAAAFGYKLGFGTRFGYIDHKSNPYHLRRININASVSDTIPLFVCRLLGLW